MGISTYDPLLGFKFVVDIASTTSMGFQKISGLSLDVGILEIAEISDPITVTKVPDRISFSDVTLERGAIPTTDYHYLWDWYMEVVTALTHGMAADFRRIVTITSASKGVSLDFDTGEGTRTWKIFNAFPKSVKFGEFDATSSAVLIESLTLANEGYKLVG